MEIKCVKKEKVEYPKINEISNTRVKCAIPDKWLKLGITSFLFNVLMQEKVFATNLIEISLDDIALAGGVSYYYNPIYSYARGGCNIVSLISVLAIIISSIMIIVKKSKAKKQGGNAKVSKKIKIVFIISIILLILSRIGYAIANYLEYLQYVE